MIKETLQVNVNTDIANNDKSMVIDTGPQSKGLFK